jgi:hypothetical protein
LPSPELEKKLDDIYSEFLHNSREFFITNDINEIISSFSSDDKIVRLNMLAEILYRELELFNTPQRNKLLAQNLLDLYSYISINSKEYSLERESRKIEIMKFLD